MLISMVNSIHKAGNKWHQVTPGPNENKHWRIKDKESQRIKKQKKTTRRFGFATSFASRGTDGF